MPTIANETATYEVLELNTVQWAKDRRIIPNAKAHTQLLKAVSECGELVEAAILGSEAEIIDAIGDISVCLINYSALKGLSSVSCISSAYHRGDEGTGQTPPSALLSIAEYEKLIQDSLRAEVPHQGDTHFLNYVALLPIPLGELADAEAKQLSGEEVELAVGAVLIALMRIASLFDKTLATCLSAAYDTIKDRKGYLTPEGTFVKEE